MVTVNFASHDAIKLRYPSAQLPGFVGMLRRGPLTDRHSVAGLFSKSIVGVPDSQTREYILSQKQFEVFADYLCRDRYSGDNFGRERFGEAEAILAISFGEGFPVNTKIAQDILDICKGAAVNKPVEVFAQWQIADQIRRLSESCGGALDGLELHRIGMPEEIGVSGEPRSIRDFEGTRALLSQQGFPLLPWPQNPQDLRDLVLNEIRGDAFFQRAIPFPLMPDKSDILSSDPFRVKETSPVHTAINILASNTKSARAEWSSGAGKLPTEEERHDITQLNLMLIKALMDSRTPPPTHLCISSEEMIKALSGVKGGVLLAGHVLQGPRHISMCKEQGFDVIGGIFADAYSTEDQKLWARDPISCLIREALKWGVMNGDVEQEVLSSYSLVIT
jgi:hypothetical protein